MIVLIKLFYAVAISCLLVLLVAFGVRTVYSGPQAPQFPQHPTVARPPSAEAPGTVSPDVARFEEEQRQYQEEYERYSSERADYRRNVLVIVSIFGIAAIAGGLALPGRLDAIRLGLVLGGLGVVLYGVIQAGEDLDEAGPALIFIVAAVGLVLILLAGYRWLTSLEETRPAG